MKENVLVGMGVIILGLIILLFKKSFAISQAKEALMFNWKLREKDFEKSVKEREFWNKITGITFIVFGVIELIFGIF